MRVDDCCQVCLPTIYMSPQGWKNSDRQVLDSLLRQLAVGEMTYSGGLAGSMMTASFVLSSFTR